VQWKQFMISVLIKIVIMDDILQGHIYLDFQRKRQELWIRNSSKFCIFLNFIYFKLCYMNQWWHSSPCQFAHTNVFLLHLHRDVLFTSSSIHASSSPKLRKCIAALTSLTQWRIIYIWKLFNVDSKKIFKIFIRNINM